MQSSIKVEIFIVGECILLRMYQISKYKQPSSQLYSSVLYYTRISRHVSANSKPSSGVVAYYVDNTRHQTTIYILQVYIS
jgi:hypothetical protein